MSSPDYIKVDSINDIDPNKLSYSFVGKKFIDKDNNRFSIRFNRETRKMEIVKILIRQGGKIQSDVGLRAWEEGKEVNLDSSESTHHHTTSENKPKTEDLDPDPSVQPVQKEILPEKAMSPSLTSGRSSKRRDASGDPDWNFDDFDMDISSDMDDVPDNLEKMKKPETEIEKEADKKATEKEAKKISEKWKDKHERDHIDSLIKSIDQTKNRINAVLTNIKTSRIYEVTGDPSDNQNIVGNLTREFDVEVFQILDDTNNYYKELISYPRAISYYTAKYEKSKKNELTMAESEKEKLHLIIRWEMQEAFTKILERLKALTLSLLDVLNLKNESHIKQLQYQNQLMFTDAKNATIFCSQDIDKLIHEVEDWKYNTMDTKNGT